MDSPAPQRYDAIVIGSGQAGNPLTLALAGAGMKVALVERDHVGGTCVNAGCTPSKTMIASARVAHLARRAAHFGVATSLIGTEMWRVRERARSVVEQFRDGLEERLRRSAGVSLFFGEAAFEAADRVRVRTHGGELHRLSAPVIVIDTGGRPKPLELPGAQDVTVLDSTTVMELGRLPEHLIVLGGSYIGLEFGQMFRRFGSRVSIVESEGQLVPREDRDVAEELAQVMRDEGIGVHLESEAVGAAPRRGGGVALKLRTPQGERELAGSHLLAAQGRLPNTESLDLSAAGVETDERGTIRVNDRLETSAPGVYAVGEVNGGPAFTHVAYDDFRVLRANLLENAGATTRERLLCYTLFTDPELGRFGLSEREARELGLNVRTAKLPMNRVARALEAGETRGFIKVLVDPATNQLLGGAVLSLEGGELAALLQVAAMAKLPYTALRDGMFAHPTLAESVNNLFSAMDAAETEIRTPQEKEQYA